MSINENMTKGERHATSALASIMSMRMLGLFMILPVFSVYAQELLNSTPFLIGLAIGIYGLTQALFQIPFGMLSDRFGRKRIITIGLVIFSIGSVVAATSDSLTGIIIGRALQGSGAISAAILAFTADLTREEHRTKAMALMGMSIGMSFIFSLVAGPILNAWIGISGIFWLTSVLALIGIIILHTLVPAPLHCRFHRDTEPVPAQFKRILRDTQLLRIDFGILVLHCLLTSLFLVVPLLLKEHMDVVEHWKLYLPIMLISIVVMIPCIIYAEKYRHLKRVLSGAVAVLAVSQIGFMFFAQQSSFAGIIVMLFLFFSAFNVLEASLPSLISKVAPPESKGTAMGVYSSAQFFGAFLGGVCGGGLYHHIGIHAVFLFCLVLTLLWFISAATMKHPRYLSSYLLNIGSVDAQQATQLSKKLSAINGVAEVVVIVEDSVAYLKIDKTRIDINALDAYSVTV